MKSHHPIGGRVTYEIPARLRSAESQQRMYSSSNRSPTPILQWIGGVLSALAWCLAPTASFASSLARHPGPSVWGEITIEDDHVLFRLEGAADPFKTCLALPRIPIGPLEPDQLQEIRTSIEKFAHDKLVMKLDGKKVDPKIDTLHIQDGKPDEASWKSAYFTMIYPSAGPPQHLTVVWPAFEGEGVNYIPIVIRRGAKGSPRQFQLYPEEPEYTWHADSVRPRITGEVKKLTGPRGTIDLPLGSLAAILLAALFLFFAPKLPRWVGIFGCGALLIAAIAMKPMFHRSVPWPFAHAAPLPSESQAKDLFKTLNANIYRAFDAETESGIYDLLADSVDAKLLDDLYGQVYESLILREQGGAICNVDSVEDIDGSVDLNAFPNSDPPQFKVTWHWRVMGAVSHWGHVHRRMNEYKADFVVGHDGESWKISSVKVTEQKRVDDFE